MSGWVAGAVVVGSVISSNASSNAADKQSQSAANAQATQQGMYDQTRADQAPWRQAGSTALGQLGTMTAPGGSMTHTFDAADLKNGLSPNYDFQLQQGLGAVNNQASVGGGLVGGNALKGINDYAQGTAANAYQQAYNNYNTNQTNIFNRLSNIAGLGQTSNGQTAQAGTTLAGNIGSAQLAGGASQAAGIVGSSNALSSGLTNAASMYSYGNNGTAANTGNGTALVNGGGFTNTPSYLIQ